MTIAEMKHHFTHRELGIQGAVGEYAILVPLAPVSYTHLTLPTNREV